MIQNTLFLRELMSLFVSNLSVLCGFTNIFVIKKLVGDVDVLFFGDLFRL